MSNSGAVSKHSYKNLNVVESREDKIIYLSVNRPDKLNALNHDVLKELKDFFLAARESILDSGMRGVIFFGEGPKAFIAGADIAQLATLPPESAYEMSKTGQEVTLLMEEFPLPIIATVHGFALGGGCEMAMGADFIYATEDAIFGQPEVKLGLIPGFGGSQRLAKLIGRGRARELMYTGANLSAKEALAYGLVTKLFKNKEEMMAGAKMVISMMAKNSRQAIAEAKKVMNLGNDLTVKDGLKIEVSSFSKLFQTEEMKEGTNAFMQKRKANF